MACTASADDPGPRIDRDAARAFPGAFIDRNPLIGLPFHPLRTARPGTRKIPVLFNHMSKSVKPQTYESALAELEEIVSDMEAGQLPLEKSLAAYKRGAELLKFCQGALQDAQQQVKILEDGVLKNFGTAGQ